MSEGPESRDAENNWVIPNTDGLPVETVGTEEESLHGQEEVKPTGCDPVVQTVGQETEGTAGAQDVKEPEVTSLPTDTPAHQEKLDIPPGEPESTGHDLEQPTSGESRGFTSRVGEDLEEVSCSSSDDDVEGLRKRLVRGSSPVNVGPTAREATQQEEDAGSSLTLNRCIIAAIALVGVGFLIFSGSGFSAEDDPSQSVITRSVTEGDNLPAGIADIQEWIQKHADQFTGDPSSLQVMNGFLDRVAKENQDIRHMQAKLQAQKEELEAMLHSSSDVKATPEPLHLAVTEENVRLKDALLREETAHLSAKEELQSLQDKLDALESSSLETEALALENAQLKVELDASRRQIEGFLAQKETLVAESQMLRVELDKQRLLLASIRQDLENLIANKTDGEDENPLHIRISEVTSKLMLETQRSETWEKKYVEHAQKRKEQIGEDKRDHAHKEWKRGRASNISAASETRKPHFKHGKRQSEEGHRESQHEEWKNKKYAEKQEQWQDKKTRHWERESAAAKREQEPQETEIWRDKAKDHKPRDSAHHHHHESAGRGWKEKHGETGNQFHPLKEQKEFSEAHRHVENNKKKEHPKKGRDPEAPHRHHDHNKFWKKLSDHQYRVREGCSGLEDCAQKDGMDLFNVALNPVHKKQFEEVLKSYLEKSQLSQHLPELLPLIDGFFEGSLFSHHKIRFKDFVDDVEDFLEELARKETGNDDIVDDFERYVYTNFFGEAASRKRFAKKKDKPTNHKKPTNEKSLESDHKAAGSQYSTENNSTLDNLDANFYDYKLHKGKSKRNDAHKQQLSNLHYKDEYEQSGHKYNQEKHAFRSHHKSPQYDRNPDTHSFNEEETANGRHSEKKSKYSKDKEHRYKPYQGDHVREDTGHYHKHKHQKHVDRQEPHYNKDRYHKENSGHKTKHDKDKSLETYGKDGHGKKYKNKQSSQHYKVSFQQEHKLEKDTTNKHYLSPEPHHDKHRGRHHEYEPWKDHGHRHKNYDRAAPHTSKSYQPQNEGDDKIHRSRHSGSH